MKILVISNYYPPLEVGGWEQLTRDVAEALQHRGHAVQVLTSNYRAAEAPAPEPMVKRILQLESSDHVYYRPYYTLTHRWDERQNKMALSKTVQRSQPDIIFINGMWNLPVSLAQHAEHLLPGRVVYYMASYWPTELDAHTAYWLGTENKPEQNWAKRWLGTLLKKTLFIGCTRNNLAFEHVLCVSKFVQDHLVKEAGIAPTHTRVVHNGVNPAIFATPNGHHSAPVLRLLYAGRLSPAKGVHTAIAALAQLRQGRADFPVQLSIVGSGSERYVTVLKHQANRLGVENAVQFWGQVPREDMPAILAKHDVLLLLSIWPEPLARMTQEAMASGLVVIGTPTGGTPEILVDGENGLMVEPEDPDALADKIRLLATDPTLRRNLAKAARQTVEEHFTFSRMVDEIETYFWMIVEDGG